MNMRCVKDSVASELPKGLEELVELPNKQSNTVTLYDLDDL